MVRPDRESFRALVRPGAAVPLAREVLADLDTPLAAFLKLDDGETSFLYESVEGGEQWARFSYIGVGARATFRAGGGAIEVERHGRCERRELPADRSVDPLAELERLLEALRPVPLEGLRSAGGAVGFLSYDWVRYVERLPESTPDTLGVPDCWFTFPETFLIHDRKLQTLTIVAMAEVDDPAQADPAYDAALERIEAVRRRLAAPAPALAVVDADATDGAAAPAVPLESLSNTTRAEYHARVERAKQYIRAGDVFQVVPSQRFTLPLRTDPVLIYRWLRAINPSPYLFFQRCGPGRVILGSSPEVHARLRDGEVVVRPIAGTRPRGASRDEDLEQERLLRSDPKELAEHIMLVDLGRNDVGRIAEIGSVRVDELNVVERYSHVLHLVSNVRGTLRKGENAAAVLRATFPAGTLTGAPKVRAMQIIDELEPERRGLYGGVVGLLDYSGDMDTCIAIRTLLIQDGKIHVQAGGGVVADSDPELEYQETLHKARGVIRAIERAGGGRFL